jgi:hypothetical protein
MLLLLLDLCPAIISASPAVTTDNNLNLNSFTNPLILWPPITSNSSSLSNINPSLARNSAQLDDSNRQQQSHNNSQGPSATTPNHPPLPHSTVIVFNIKMAKDFGNLVDGGGGFY